MSETAPSWLRDDTPTKHRIMRIIFFVGSFTWSIHSIQDYSASTPIEKLFTRMLPLLIVAVYTFTCEYRDRIKTLFRPGMMPLLWYVLVGVLSGINSIQPAMSAWKGCEILITLLWFTVSCRDADSTRREFVAFAWLFEILIWVTIALALINPDRGFYSSPTFLPWIRGYMPIINGNGLGFISLWVIVRLLFLPARRKPLRLFITGLTLLCAQSRTSYAVFVCALAIFVFDSLRNRKLGNVAVASFFGLAGLALAFGWFDVILKVVARGATAETMQSLSGRTDYWNFAYQYASWFGNGLATGSRSLIFMSGSDIFRSGLIALHNSFLEAILDTGYIGAVPFIALLVFSALRQTAYTFTKPDPVDYVFMVYAIAFFARGMTSISLALFSSDFLLLILFYYWLYARQISSTPQPRVRPMPRAYEKTLSEIEKESKEFSCQSNTQG